MFQKKLMLLVFGIAAMSLNVPAQAACDGSGCSAGCNSCCTACPQCNASCKTCKLKIDEEEVSKHCWRVECEEICVPNIVWPWQKSCCNPAANNGACVRTVKVLKKHSYKCPECSYSWSLDDGCGGCASGCNGGAGGCSADCDACSGGGAAWSPSQPTWDGGAAPISAPGDSATPAEVAPPATDAPVPAAPAAPQSWTPVAPQTQPVNGGEPGFYDSTSKKKRATLLPVRFIRAARAKASRK